MAYEALRGPEEIIEADAEANVLYDLVRVLGVDIILYGHRALLGEILRRDLDEIGNLGLNRRSVRMQLERPGGGRGLTSRNMKTYARKRTGIWAGELQGEPDKERVKRWVAVRGSFFGGVCEAAWQKRPGPPPPALSCLR